MKSVPTMLLDKDQKKVHDASNIELWAAEGLSFYDRDDINASRTRSFLKLEAASDDD